jgi:ABC-2 type transport system permease protein
MLNLIQAEVLKMSKLVFMRVAVLIPAGFCVSILAILFIVKLTGSDMGNPLSPPNTGPDLGTGAFTFGSFVFFTGIGNFYALGLVIIAGLIIQNEYNWNTIKMLAIREPSRTRLVLSKAAYMAVFAVALVVIFSLSWLIYSFGVKLVYDQPFGLADEDGEAILKGLKYVSLAFLLYLIWSLLGLALAIRFKSLVAAIVAYLFYSGLDYLVSSIGARALNGRLGFDFPGWLGPLIDTAKIVSPFLLNTSFTRLTGRQSDPNFVESISPVQALLVMLVWGALFTFLAIQIFKSRDITD